MSRVKPSQSARHQQEAVRHEAEVIRVYLGLLRALPVARRLSPGLHGR